MSNSEPGTSHDVSFIDYKTLRSPAHDRRVRFLVLHYTERDFATSVKLLAGPDAQVSSHYLVPNPEDQSFIQSDYYTKHNKKLKAFALVSEENRAWHAGVSSWGNDTGRRYNINDQSIGIEIVNTATEDFFPEFNDAQIDLVIELCQYILSRHPDIRPWHILGHSDIAWDRKVDPGPAFPWKKLYESGIGVWYDESDVKDCYTEFQQEMPDISEFIGWLRQFGYVLDKETPENVRQMTKAFQMRFRPDCFDGEPDAETAAIAYSLIKRYLC